MPKKLRVKLEPVLGSARDGGGGVAGVRVVLTRHGPDFSSAKWNTKVPAKLTFQARLFEKARAQEPSETVELGSLEGELLLGPQQSTSFAITKESLAVLGGGSESEATPTLEAGSTPRKLALLLEAPQFTGAPRSPAPQLELPAQARRPDFEFVELAAELSVAGGAEAELESVDILDVPLAPRPIFGLRVVDDLGEPLDALVELEVAGRSERLKTDAAGWVRVDSLGAPQATARLAEPAAVLAILKQRWNKPRPGGRISPGPGFTVVPVERASDAVTLSERLHTLSIQPRVQVARLFGMFFDTNKSFLLPLAISGVRAVKRLYDENPKSKLLIVGHTDTTAEAGINDPLSLERADSMAAYLKDDVGVWVKRYSNSISESRRWGAGEDLAMIESLQTQGPEVDGEGDNELDPSDPVRFYQEFHNRLPAAARAKNFEPLEVDGVLGDKTRKQLIGDYMNHDGTSLPEGIEIVTHGCGENFPLSEGGFSVDSDPENPKEDQADRRVELFFFDEDFGIQPPPPGKNSKPGSKEYPEWRRRQGKEFDFDLSPRAIEVIVSNGADAPIAGVIVQAVFAEQVLVTARTDDRGSCAMFVPRTEGLRLKITEVDEERLVSGDPELDGLVTTADEAATGVPLPDEDLVVVTLVLLDLEFALDDTQLASPVRSVRLKSGDGAFDQTQLLPNAAEEEVTQSVTFLGLPTLGKRYSLSVLTAGEERPVFSELTMTQLVESIELDRDSLVEAEPDPDERTAKLDELDQGEDGDVAVA
jgi:outer membrane protein OmpA-like peptidoglycan-associated protein